MTLPPLVMSLHRKAVECNNGLTIHISEILLSTHKMF